LRSYLVRVVKMKRVMLIGPGGAGKSRLARKMGVSLGLPMHHLDRLNWPRPDTTEGCDERFNLEFLGFLRWIWDYPQTKRPGILQQLEEMKEDKRVIVLRSRREVGRFLRSLA